MRSSADFAKYAMKLRAQSASQSRTQVFVPDDFALFVVSLSVEDRYRHDHFLDRRTADRQ
jgi:hypothetical protein